MIWNSTIDLNESILKDVIRQHVADHPEMYGYNPQTDTIKDVVVDVRNRIEGYGMGEHDVTYLKNVSVLLERDTEKGVCS